MLFGSKENIDDFLSNIWQALAIEGGYMFDGSRLTAGASSNCNFDHFC